MRDKNKRKLLLIALIAVGTISIGFAAFSSSLLIRSSLNVNPDSSTFKIVFSTNSSTVSTGSVSGVASPSSAGIMVEPATISNEGAYPTISGLGATLTEPGQSVSYSFYAINHPDYSKYDAYLTSIVFQAKSNGKFITCQSENGTTTAAINEACNNISVSVKVGGDSAVTSTKTGIENHLLSQNSSELVTITLSYGGTVRADEKFNVSIGDIYLTYGTQMTDENPDIPTNGKICTAVDASKSGNTTPGVEYTCQVNDFTSYNFYVLNTNENNVNLIMSENLIDNVNFADSTNFSLNEEGTTTPGAYDATFISNPLVVTTLDSFTQSWNNLANLNETYSTYATFNGKARLAKMEEIAETICTTKNYNNGGPDEGYYYSSCPSWITGDYWTISKSVDFTKAWGMNSTYNTLDQFTYRDDFEFYNPYNLGIRPVITVPQSQLG